MENNKLLKLTALALSLVDGEDRAWVMGKVDQSIIPILQIYMNELKNKAFMSNKCNLFELLIIVGKKLMLESKESKARPASKFLQDKNVVILDAESMLNTVDVLYLALAEKFFNSKFDINIDLLSKTKIHEINSMLEEGDSPLSKHVQSELDNFLEKKLCSLKYKNNG